MMPKELITTNKNIKRLSISFLKKQSRSILCLNGKLPNKRFFQANLPIVAADGAANLLLKKSILPDVIIGDLDSINLNNFDKSIIFHAQDQNFTDFQKALFYLKKQNLLPSLICGVDGGFIDHILHNIAVIIENKCMFYAPPVLGIALEKGEYLFKLNFDNKISLFGIEAKVSTKGLKWELDNYILKFPKKNSLSNRLKSESLEINVKKGKVLLLIYERAEI